MKLVVFSELARLELLDSQNWYEQKELGLGNRFKKVIKSEIEWIAKNPKISPKIRFTEIYCKVVNVFPYYIYYEPPFRCEYPLVPFSQTLVKATQPKGAYAPRWTKTWHKQNI